MTARPCIACGEVISTGTRCSTCTPADTKKARKIAHAGTDSQWRRLSLRARRMQPFCIDCHTDQDLTADHIIPVDVAPELAYTTENITVRCRPHNSARGNRYTQAEAEQVLNALLSAQARRSSPRLRKLIPVAQRAVQVGTRPPEQHEHPGGKAQGALLFGCSTFSESAIPTAVSEEGDILAIRNHSQSAVVVTANRIAGDALNEDVLAVGTLVDTPDLELHSWSMP